MEGAVPKPLSARCRVWEIDQSAAAGPSFGLSSVLRKKSHIDNRLPLARLEDETESGAILV